MINAAVGAAPGKLLLRRPPGQSWASSTVGGSGEPIEVTAVDLDSLIGKLGSVSILKVDIEGAEHSVLAASRRLDAVDCIVGEVHPVPGATTEGFFAGLAEFDVVPGRIVDGKGTFIANRRPRSANSRR